jgi:hypothetical protein
MTRVSARAYAKRIGVSGSYISRLVRDGKLPVDAQGMIDPEDADRVLARALRRWRLRLDQGRADAVVRHRTQWLARPRKDCRDLTRQCPIVPRLGRPPRPAGLRITVIAQPPLPWQGHVGLYEGEDKTHIRLLGANQNDSVSRGWFAKSRLIREAGRVISFRWPKGLSPSDAGPVQLVRGNAAGTPELLCRLCHHPRSVGPTPRGWCVDRLRHRRSDRHLGPREGDQAHPLSNDPRLPRTPSAV